MSFWRRLREFFSGIFSKKQETVATPVQGVPTEQVEFKPTGIQPAAPAPVVISKPTVIENLLGGGKLPPVIQDAKPVTEADFNYQDGFAIIGSGHPVRNKLPAGSYTFTFVLPKDGPFQINIGEVPGTQDAVVVMSVHDVQTGNIDLPPTSPMNVRTAIAYGKGNAGAKNLVVALSKDSSFLTEVYC